MFSVGETKPALGAVFRLIGGKRKERRDHGTERERFLRAGNAGGDHRIGRMGRASAFGQNFSAAISGLGRAGTKRPRRLPYLIFGSED